MSDTTELRAGQPVPATVTRTNSYSVEGARQSVVSVSIEGGLVINDLSFPGVVNEGDLVQVQRDPRSGTNQIIGTYPAPQR